MELVFRRGERGYLERDGISHAFNVEVHVGGEFTKLGNTKP